MFSSLIHDFETELRAQLPAAMWPLLRTPEVQPLHAELFAQHDIRVDVLRCDTLHPVISGNKWFKLKFNLVDAHRRGCVRLASFGGAWSNHLHALAYCAQQVGFASEGFVRGEELSAQSNPMLHDAETWGMQLHFLSRQDYRQRRITIDADTLLIPEGGDNFCGLLGCMTMMPPTLAALYDSVVVPVGTGCTALGIRMALPPQVPLWAVPVLKGAGLEAKWRARLRHWQAAASDNVHWLADAHHGGYGKTSPALLSFIHEIGDNTGLLLDPVYTGKALWALCQQIRHQALPAGSRVLFIHTGGLQGARGFQSG